MNDASIEVIFGGQRKKLMATLPQQELPLATLLRRAGVPLNTRCGERGVCEGCLVEPVEGVLINIISGADVDARYAGLIRACQHRVRHGSSTAVIIPDRSRLGNSASVVTDFICPLAHDRVPIWRQIQDAAGGWNTEEFVDGSWQVVRTGRPQIERPLGLAIDIGTTTIVVLLADLATGEILARASDFNQQLHLGDDVLTRITLCTEAGIANELRRAVVEKTIVPLVHRCISLANVNCSDVVVATAAGNTTMLHLFAGEDPTPLGFVPFEAVFLNHRVLRGDLLEPWGLSSGLRPTVHLLPGSSAYVGADLSAGLIASALIDDEGPSVLVDVGTNGEMILKHAGRLLACATAAGPAFEGSRLSCGMRAGDGAIDHIQFSSDPFSVETHTIGESKPIGFCGSFYIDFLAEGSRIGLIDERGRYEDGSTGEYRSRLSLTDCHGRAFRVARGLGGKDLFVTEADIAALLTAKASIAAGLETLLSKAGVGASAIRHLYVAGGFGTRINLHNAISMGLFAGFEATQIRVVGNTALAGAWLAMLDAAALERMCVCAPQVDVIELNQDAEFEDRYISHLQLKPAR